MIGFFNTSTSTRYLLAHSLYYLGYTPTPTRGCSLWAWVWADGWMDGFPMFLTIHPPTISCCIVSLPRVISKELFGGIMIPVLFGVTHNSANIVPCNTGIKIIPALHWAYTLYSHYLLTLVGIKKDTRISLGVTHDIVGIVTNHHGY